MAPLLALALAPGFAIIFYIYSKDKYDREPFRNLFLSFLLGVLSTIPAIVIQTLAEPLLPRVFNISSITYYIVFAFGLVAFSEEGSKFIMLRAYAYRQRAFNEPFDGIIYSVMVSMGFATLENIGYVLQHGYYTGLLRMFLSVPAHAAFGVLMGYHTGLAKFDPQHAVRHLLTGLLLAILFHGAFDFFLFLQNNPNVTKHVSTSLLAAGSLITYWIAIRMSLRAIRQHQDLSRKVFDNPHNII